MFAPSFAEVLKFLNDQRAIQTGPLQDRAYQRGRSLIDLMAGELLNEDRTDAQRQLAAGMQSVQNGGVVAGYLTIAGAYDVLEQHADAFAALCEALKLAPENPDVRIALAHHDFYYRREKTGIEGPLAAAWDVYQNAPPPGSIAQDRARALLQSAYEELVEDGGMSVGDLPSALRQYVNTRDMEAPTSQP